MKCFAAIGILVLAGCAGAAPQSAPSSVLSLNQPAAIDGSSLSASVWVEDFHCGDDQCMFLVHYAASGSGVVSTDNWRAFADGKPMEQKFLPDGDPRPGLPAITVAAGQTVVGWIYFVSPLSVIRVELDLLASATGGTLASWEMAANQ